jgi:hypothetical protein
MRKNTTHFQLGWFIGHYIYDMYLPTLSTDMLHSRKVIQVTIDEADKYHALEEKWFKTNSVPSPEENTLFEEMRSMSKELARKYLPNTLKCYTCSKLTIPTDEKDLAELKVGIRSYLWDTDLCWYHIEKDEDINIYREDDGWSTVIELKLDA